MSKAVGDLVIRNARPEELDEAARVLVESYQQYSEVLSPERWEAYRQNILDVRSRLGESDLIIAERDGPILGSVTFYPAGSRRGRGSWPPDWAGVRLVGVHPDARGQGVARALIDECIRRCREQGTAALALHTTEIMTVAQGMYERMGFVRINEHDFRPGDGAGAMAYRLDL